MIEFLITFAVLISVILLYRILILKQYNFTSQFTTEKKITEKKDIAPLIARALKEGKFTHIHQAGNMFYAHASTSMSSWSEIIKVSYKLKPDGNVIEFTSKCAVPIQIFDWGKNRRNAKRFFAHLEKQIH